MPVKFFLLQRGNGTNRCISDLSIAIFPFLCYNGSTGHTHYLKKELEAMIKLLKNANVYAPAPLGKKDILVEGEKILLVEIGRAHV